MGVCLKLKVKMTYGYFSKIRIASLLKFQNRTNWYRHNS